MPFLYSNYPPAKTDKKSYPEAFRELLKACDRLDIATGYISTDSLIDLASTIEANKKPYLNLCIGMHYFEGVAPTQLQALERLQQVLSDNNLGNIYFIVTFPFHGKMTCFTAKNSPVGAIIGSSNLSNIVTGGARQYEADFLFNAPSTEIEEIGTFIASLVEKSAKPFEDVDLLVVEQPNELLNDQYGVEAASPEENEAAKYNLTNQSFELPVKADEAPGSNLNTHFGKGRVNIQGFVVPRSWYEVELIVPRDITTQDGYPQADPHGDGGVFNVITDDGWKFSCRVSGDNSKNLRSDGDLKILGKWLKGRLEQKGILKPGERVTDETLESYGRKTITMTKLAGKPKLWYFNFGVKP